MRILDLTPAAAPLSDLTALAEYGFEVDPLEIETAALDMGADSIWTDANALTAAWRGVSGAALSRALDRLNTFDL